MRQYLRPAFGLMLLFTLLTGLAYPLVVTALCQSLFPSAANGSLLRRHGAVIGSRLIGQAFARPGYFHPRPSAAGAQGYDPTASGGSNLGPTNAKLIARVHAAVAAFRRHNPAFAGPIPADLLTASGSGLDPDLSPDAALAQVARVAAARGADASQVQALVLRHIHGRLWGFVGEPRVNVLDLNLALDAAFPKSQVLP
ncbi:MAG TPA: potassium-transporting ATPase subunit KdpC [Terriglobales bacterium]|nr:potassium-transporting ATPase subunit KdpC [Terriglobales bacterium]